MATKRQGYRTLLTKRQVKKMNGIAHSDKGKGKKCGQASGPMKIACKRNRSYKTMRDYDQVMAILTRRARGQ